MGDLLLAWGVFPAVLALLTLGCGRLARLVCPQLPGPLLAPVGFALLVVVGGFATLADATAELALPLAITLALAGFAVGGLPRPTRAHIAPAIAAAVVFAAYSAPIVLSGEATFAGYIKLDDTATWMALTDRVMEHGRSLDGLAPSTYEATLAFNLADGYPVGVFVPLGIASSIVGQDVAWAIQPYMAFLAALLALSLYELGAPLVRSRALRAGVAILAAQPALLYGYYLWGGVKEIAAAALIAVGAALLGIVLRSSGGAGGIAALALVVGALGGVLSGGGLVWLGPALLAGAILLARRVGARTAALRAGGFLLLAAVFAIPVLVGGLVPPTSAPLTSSDAMGNLAGPLDPLQVAGVWPAGDFRFDPDSELLAGLLVAAAIALAALGAAIAVRRRAEPAVLYVLGALVACAAIAALGSPWVDGKALATASPAIPFAAALAGAALWLGGWRFEGALALGAVAIGIMWSNVLAYGEVNLAPRDQLAELETIGEEIAGAGPTLITEYQPYGARHFLREADAEGVSELRRRRIPRVGGELVPKGEWADTDELSIPDLFTYRTLVLRRTPEQSRPPLTYGLIAFGEHYEVWQRPASEPPALVHLPLGGRSSPIGTPGCSEVLALARRATPGGQLVAAARPAPLTAALRRAGGAATATVQVTRPGRYEIWVRDSVRAQAELRVDGALAGTVRHVLNNDGLYARLGTATLEPGTDEVEVRVLGADLHPGSARAAPPLGPLALMAAGPAATDLRRVDPADARSLCGRAFDWIAVAP